MAFVKESLSTRKILWLTCVSGCSGKSLLTDVLELDPTYGVCRLTLDYNRSFKFISAVDIKSYIDTHGGSEPKCFVIDAPRDQENHYLHDIYSVLEEISNGRVEGSFSGRRIKIRIRRNIPIIVFSNSAPLLRSLSFDRWDIKAIFPVGNDFFLQNAQIHSVILNAAQNLVTWHNIVETVPISYNSTDNLSELDQMLLDMYQKYCYFVQQQGQLPVNVISDFRFDSVSNFLPLGCIRLISSEQTMEINRAPENVKREYQLVFPKKI